MKEKIKINGKTYVAVNGGCSNCELDAVECYNVTCAGFNYGWKRCYNPIKETIIILCILSIIGIGFYFIHKSA